jgi:hypothetical protein
VAVKNVTRAHSFTPRILCFCMRLDFNRIITLHRTKIWFFMRPAPVTCTRHAAGATLKSQTDSVCHCNNLRARLAVRTMAGCGRRLGICSHLSWLDWYDLMLACQRRRPARDGMLGRRLTWKLRTGKPLETLACLASLSSPLVNVLVSGHS